MERLIKDRHTSPLEHAVFQFRVRAPIFVVRQWFRHRFASYNEESGRYVELEDQFYLPERLRARVGKAMDYRYADLPEADNAAAPDWPSSATRGAPVAATTADSSSVEASSPSGTSSLPDRPQPRSS